MGVWAEDTRYAGMGFGAGVVMELDMAWTGGCQLGCWMGVTVRAPLTSHSTVMHGTREPGCGVFA